MKIGILGYGKMGKMIEQLGTEQGHEIVWALNECPPAETIQVAEVVIEFSQPEAAYDNLLACLQAQVPVVCGTTGWLDRFGALEEVCQQLGGAFLYASNYSIGVNLFFALNEQLAQLMAKHPGYEVELEEIHHTQKLDAPSGTAISLAEGLLQHLPHKNQWEKDIASDSDAVAIKSQRVDPTPGTHSIRYTSLIDDIEIKHTAHSRKGFASGAILAAQWLIGKTGVFGMRDVLGF